jgi:hypothetical protein
MKFLEYQRLYKITYEVVFLSYNGTKYFLVVNKWRKLSFKLVFLKQEWKYARRWSNRIFQMHSFDFAYLAGLVINLFKIQIWCYKG